MCVCRFLCVVFVYLLLWLHVCVFDLVFGACGVCMCLARVLCVWSECLCFYGVCFFGVVGCVLFVC